MKNKILRTLSPLLSRRLAMTLIGLYILRNSFWGIVTGLDGFTDPQKVTAYTTMANWYFTAIAALVMGYVGVTSWRGGMTVASVMQSTFESVNKKEEIQSTEKIIQEFANRYKDDPSYAPIKPDTEEAFR
jgi:hypothetical protein